MDSVGVAGLRRIYVVRTPFGAHLLWTDRASGGTITCGDGDAGFGESGIGSFGRRPGLFGGDDWLSSCWGVVVCGFDVAGDLATRAELELGVGNGYGVGKSGGENLLYVERMRSGEGAIVTDLLRRVVSDAGLLAERCVLVVGVEVVALAEGFGG